MNDLKPFRHGEEGTHFCCETRLKNEGDKARCCECVPHSDCDYDINQKKYNFNDAKKIANKYLELLKPFCSRIEIAGSIRREKPEVKDIEIVCIPKDLFGFVKEVNKLEKVKGEPTGKYTQRILPEGIKLDLFMATETNWGYIFAIRTGSAEFSKNVLAYNWVKAGYKGVNGMLMKDGQKVECREEEDLFNLIGIEYIEPKKRS